MLPDPHACQALSARLGDFLEEPNDNSSLEIQDRTLTNDYHHCDEEAHDTRSTTLDLESFLQDIRQPKVSDRSLTAELLSSDAFPRLGISEETAQRAVRGVWAEPNPSVHSSYTHPVHAPKAGTTMLSFRKSPLPTDQFPQLATPSQRSKDIESCMWADMLKGQSAREERPTRDVFAGKNEREADIASTQSKKKTAKWVPLPI